MHRNINREGPKQMWQNVNISEIKDIATLGTVLPTLSLTLCQNKKSKKPSYQKLHDPIFVLPVACISLSELYASTLVSPRP